MALRTHLTAFLILVGSAGGECIWLVARLIKHQSRSVVVGLCQCVSGRFWRHLVREPKSIGNTVESIRPIERHVKGA